MPDEFWCPLNLCLTTVFLMPHRAFQLGLVWLIKYAIVLTVFLVEIWQCLVPAKQGVYAIINHDR